MNAREQMQKTIIVVMLLALITLLITCGSAEQRMTFIKPQGTEEAQSEAAQGENEANSVTADTDAEVDADGEEDETESDDETADSETEDDEEAWHAGKLDKDTILDRCAELIDALVADTNTMVEQNEESGADAEESEARDSDDGLTDEEYVELEKTYSRIQEIYDAVFDDEGYLTNKAYRERVAPYEEELDTLEARMLELASKADWEMNLEDDDFADEQPEEGNYHGDDISSGHDHFQGEGPAMTDGRHEYKDDEDEYWPGNDGFDDGFNGGDEDCECDGADYEDDYETDEQSDNEQEYDEHD